jgi:hypothetical protein
MGDELGCARSLLEGEAVKLIATRFHLKTSPSRSQASHCQSDSLLTSSASLSLPANEKSLGDGEEGRVFLITRVQRHHSAPQREVHMLCDKLGSESKLHCRAFR